MIKDKRVKAECRDKREGSKNRGGVDKTEGSKNGGW